MIFWMEFLHCKLPVIIFNTEIISPYSKFLWKEFVMNRCPSILNSYGKEYCLNFARLDSKDVIVEVLHEKIIDDQPIFSSFSNDVTKIAQLPVDPILVELCGKL